MERQIGSSSMENSMEFPQETKMELLYDTAYPLKDLFKEKTKTVIQKNVGTAMLIAAFLTIAKTWKQPNKSVD